MEKGLVRVLEVFLAIQLLVIFLGTMQATKTPEYRDPYNLPRLKDNADNLAFSICSNSYLRKNITEKGQLPNLNMSEILQKDIAHAEKLYTGTYFSNQVDSNNNFKNHPGVITSACVITGHTQNTSTTSVNPSKCSEGATCTSKLSSSNGEYQNLSSGETMSIQFTVEDKERGHRNTLIIDAFQDGDGTTSVSIYDGTTKIEAGTLNFSSTGNEEKILLLNDYLPDARGNYNVTLEPTVGTHYDQVKLNVTKIKPYYNPYKILVGVWNK